MWQFSIQSRKVKGWNRSCVPSFIKPIHCINYWFVVLYYSKVLKPIKNLHSSLHICICLKNKRKIDVIALAIGFIEDLGDTIMNLALIGLLCILGIQSILGNWRFSIGMLSIPNLVFKSLIFLSIISFAEKPPQILCLFVYSLFVKWLYLPFINFDLNIICPF